MIKGALLSPAACEPHRLGSCTWRNSAPYELGQRTSFWVAASVVAHTLWTSAAPAMTYPLFAEEWHLTHTVTTGVFAIYPIVVAAVLVGFGDVPDYVGRRTAILWGVGASLVGTLLFALAPDVLRLSSKIYDLSEKNADPPKEVGKKVQTRDFCSRAAFAAALERFLERPQVDFLRPGGTRLAMDVPVIFGDRVNAKQTVFSAFLDQRGAPAA